MGLATNTKRIERFFFEKKPKTSGLEVRGGAGSEPKGIKVFWFFFSKKNKP
jgi:hypothetical protein